ncbi:MAG TPA: glycosyltransferase family 39 protein [Candidatus Acidoferrales bacterium]|nr:glycosyltransferase family 39 protein [Candidatus Acidoferrales bacterium]
MSEIRVAVLEEQPALRESSHRVAVSAVFLLAVLSVVKLLIQFAGIGHYGFFRDELYYMACGEHLAWGYVDQPPLIAVVAWLSRHLFGNSLASLRLFPVLAGSAVVWITGALAGELGGGLLAQFLAAAAILFAPAYLAFDSFFSMNAFEPLFWLLCAWIVVRIVNGSSPRLWVVFGVVAGLGLENKHSMLVFGFALAAGLLLSGQSRLFRSKWIWLGALVAFAIFLPNLLWEARHGWPQIEVVRNAQLYKNVHVSPLRFLEEQIIFLHPVALPIWLGGLAWYFFSDKGKQWHFLGWTYLIVLGIFMLFNGKTYYPLPVYPVLMAAGGVAWERFLKPGGPWRRSFAIALPVLLVVGGLQAVPFGVPVLPVNAFLRYLKMIPASFHVRTERDATVPLPQLYADMFGWDNMAETVARVYHNLPASEQAGCAILAGNYGEAGAIDYYGPKLGLPKAISGHNSYYYWGPRNYSGSCVIIFGERATQFAGYFGEVQRVATITNPHAMAVEQNVPVYLCHEPSEPLSVLWPRFKMII